MMSNQERDSKEVEDNGGKFLCGRVVVCQQLVAVIGTEVLLPGYAYTLL